MLVNQLKDAKNGYFRDGYLTRWHNQPKYIEVMIEKDALRGAFRHVLQDRHVRIIPNRGWSSKVYKQLNIDRLVSYSQGHNGEKPKEVHVLYFGDYDPSGLRMSDNLADELARYGIGFKRVGLNHNHIQEFGLEDLRNPDPDVIDKLNRDPNREKFRYENNGELFQIELDALQKSPEQFSDLVLAIVDEFYDNDIAMSNLQQYTPEGIDELINAKIRFL